MDQIYIVVEDGLVQSVHGTPAPGSVKISIIDMDTQDPESQEKLQRERELAEVFYNRLY